MLLELGLKRQQTIQTTIEPRVVNLTFRDVQQIVQRRGRIPVLVHSQLATRSAQPVDR